MGFINKRTVKRNHENVRFENKTIQSFEIINPLPVSFNEGIADITAFNNNVEAKVYEDLLVKLHPDVIHIHTH